MSGAICERFPACPNSTNDATVPKCEKDDCPGRASWASFFHHVTPNPDACKHDFQGWQEHKDDDGRVMGGEQVCTKCGIGADTVAYIEVMYPRAIEATSSTFKTSVRNHIYNQIMAAIKVNDAGQIEARA